MTLVRLENVYIVGKDEVVRGNIGDGIEEYGRCDGAGIDARKRHETLEVVERVRSRPVVRCPYWMRVGHLDGVVVRLAAPFVSTVGCASVSSTAWRWLRGSKA